MAVLSVVQPIVPVINVLQPSKMYIFGQENGNSFIFCLEWVCVPTSIIVRDIVGVFVCVFTACAAALSSPDIITQGKAHQWV